MIDYHIHPDYSIDAEPFSMNSYCQKAVELGLKDICFTPHCEFDPIRQHLDWSVRCGGMLLPMHPVLWLDKYFKDIEECAVHYAPMGLKVKAGLEAGFDLGLEKEIEAVLTEYPFDFVIGSVHCLNHIAISSNRESAGYFRGKSSEKVARGYYKTLREAVVTGLFDVVGHLDIYRRHGTKFLGESINSAFREYIDDVLELMVKTGTGLELNTSSRRYGQGAFYPAVEILKEAVKKGVTSFTVGSDCHRLSELGLRVTEALDIAERCGVKVSVYENRRAEAVSKSGIY